MDALRIERVCWSFPLGGFLAVLVAGFLAPDPTGGVWVVGALVASAVTVPLSYWFLTRFESDDARVGDLTVELVAFIAVFFLLHTLLDAVGVGGFVNNLISLLGGQAAFNRAQRWNPVPRSRGEAL
ncbi:hypothetical protein [Halopelagius longus]|uniref:Uncharacterized protein n=1 Tax=Halopelagius longus TaxID=1236180 RepID=A0A1H1DVT7_9EURY|nr:hypothetical protein [Halopelagius longus]RDI71493.1 hypothetical protein DWB78_07035 [Halopelagius longus]SDQ80652.1 hypothetical protein SAMN05216278_2611 [Halopelagius longus]